MATAVKEAAMSVEVMALVVLGVCLVGIIGIAGVVFGLASWGMYLCELEKCRELREELFPEEGSDERTD